MAASNTASRFRPATDFPKQIQSMERQEADALYEEMRACLIFTNRSRGQLIRRNGEHKDNLTQMRDRVGTLQALINQLQSQKQIQLAEKQHIINQLAAEMQEMDSQVGMLAEAFDAVGDFDPQGKTHWGYIMFPTGIRRLLHAVKSLMQWYKRDDAPALTEDVVTTGRIDEQDRRDHPERYTDQASINRDLLDR